MLATIANWLKKNDGKLIFYGLSLSLTASFFALLFWPINLADALYYSMRMGFQKFDKPASEPAWAGCKTVLSITRLTITFFTSWAVIKGYMHVIGHNLDRISVRLFFSDYVVVLGGGKMAAAIATAHVKNRSEPTKKRKLLILAPALYSKEVEELKSKGVTVITVDLTDEKELRKLMRKASLVYIAADEDARNTQILETVRCARKLDAADQPIGGISPARARITTCIVHVTSDFIAQRLTGHSRRYLAEAGLDVRLFNCWKNGARRLMVEEGPDKYSPVQDPDARAPHVLLLGYSHVGQQVVEQLARLGHFAYGRKVRCTLVSPAQTQAASRLFGKYPALTPPQDGQSWSKAASLVPVIDIDVIEAPIDGAIMSHPLVLDGPPVSVAYICPETAEEGFAALHSMMLQSPLATFPLILVSEVELEGLGHLIGSSDSSNAVQRRLKVFNALQEGVHMEAGEAFINQFAERESALVHLHFLQKLHASHLAQELACCDLALMAKSLRLPSTDPVISEMWEKIEKQWIEMPDEWERESSRDVIRHLAIKQRYAGGDLSAAVAPERCTELAKMEHARWAAERLLRGWRFGEERDDARLLRPDLVPFEGLSLSSQAKDALIIEVSELINQSRRVSAAPAGEPPVVAGQPEQMQTA